MSDKKLEKFQAELAIAMGNLDSLCHAYGYRVTPTIILRHAEGPHKSMMVGNDEPAEIIACVQAMPGLDLTTVEISPREAALHLMTQTKTETVQHE